MSPPGCLCQLCYTTNCQSSARLAAWRCSRRSILKITNIIVHRSSRKRCSVPEPRRATTCVSIIRADRWQSVQRPWLPVESSSVRAIDGCWLVLKLSALVRGARQNRIDRHFSLMLLTLQTGFNGLFEITHASLLSNRGLLLLVMIYKQKHYFELESYLWKWVTLVQLEFDNNDNDNNTVDAKTSNKKLSIRQLLWLWVGIRMQICWSVRYFRGPRIEIGDRTQDSDLLLLKLDKAVETSAHITSIELPEVGTSWASNQTAVVSGFGELPGDDLVELEPPQTLQYTKLPILNKRDCLTMLRKMLPVRVSSYMDPHPRVMNYQELRLKVAPETILCAEFKIGGYNSCTGHSGGPLAVCATPLTSGGEQLCEGNRWQLAGFFSEDFIYECGPKPKIPAIFTNVAPFADWIRRTINNNWSQIQA